MAAQFWRRVNCLSLTGKSIKVRRRFMSPQRFALAPTILVLVLAILGQPAASQPGEKGQDYSPIVPVVRSDEELLILQMRFGRYILSDGIIGYIHRGGVLLSLDEVTRALEFPITVDLGAGQATGWFLSENRRFSLDVARGEVVVAGRADSFDPSLVEVHSDGIYVDATLFGHWFPIDIEFDLARLIINVTSREPLPIERRLEREKAQARLGRGGAERPVYPRVVAPYGFWDWPFIDANSNFDYRGGVAEGHETRYSGLISGDLCYLSSVLFVAGNDDSLTDVRFTLGRTDPDGTLLGPLHARSLSFGDIFTPQIPLISLSRAGRGAEISNFPLSRASEFDRTTLRGELPLNWEVELYRNEVLLDVCLPRADGRYEFIDVPLLYGHNILRLIFYGPQGQKREEVQRILVGAGLVRPGRLYYRLAANQQDKYLFRVREPVWEDELEGEGRFIAEYELGIGRAFSVSGGGASLPFAEGRRHYANLGLRTAILGAFAHLDVSQQYRGGTAMQLATQVNILGHNLFVEHGRFFDFVSERMREESDPVESLSRLRLNGVIPLWPLPRIPFSVTGDLERRESGRTRANVSNRLSMFLLGISVSNTLNGSQSRGGGTETTIRVNGSLLVSGRLKRLSLRAQLSYEPPPDHRFISVAVTGDYKIPRNFSLRLTANHQLLDDRRVNYSVGLNRAFDAFLFGVDGRYEDDENFAVRLSISFSLGWQPHSKRLLLQSRKMGKNGAASVHVFLDQNQNGRFDADDRPLPGVRLRHGGRAVKETDANGVVFIPDLSSYRPTDITIDVGSLEDPYWIPTSEGVTVMPRPGKSVLLEFPIIATGEVDGMVYLRRETSMKGVSNVELQLVNTEDEVVQQVKTAYDGFYLFTLVPPGRYTVRVSPDQVKRLNLAQPPDREVAIEGSGTIAGGVDFTIERAE